MRDPNLGPLKRLLLAAGLLAAAGCNGGLGYPGIFKGPGGSCTAPEVGGYVACEDYLGTDYDSAVGQSLCRNFTQGTWSQDSCPSSGALGTCSVVPLDTGDAQTVQYTYYPSPDPDAGTATALTAETACGLAGGTFTPG